MFQGVILTLLYLAGFDYCTLILLCIHIFFCDLQIVTVGTGGLIYRGENFHSLDLPAPQRMSPNDFDDLTFALAPHSGHLVRLVRIAKTPVY